LQKDAEKSGHVSFSRYNRGSNMKLTNALPLLTLTAVFLLGCKLEQAEIGISDETISQVLEIIFN